jgi:membrane protease subunit HflC
MRKRFWLIVLLVGGVLLVQSCLYTVDRTEFVYVTQFGRHVHTFDGARDDDAGLHVKWPWPVQSVQRLDRRLQYFDLPGAELMTRDRDRRTIDKTLTIDAYVCWRIADGEHVDQFVRAIGTGEGAKAILSQRLSSELGAFIGEMQMHDLVSTDEIVDNGQRKSRVDVQRDQLRQNLLKQVQQAKEKYGIEVVDVRLRRTNHPASVRQAIYDRIISERDGMAAEHESEGLRLAANIKNASEHRIRNMQTDAEVAALAEKNQAESFVHATLNKAQETNAEFFAFLNTLDFYKAIFGDNKSQLILSMSRDIFKSFRNPPALTPQPKPGAMDKD